jgi:hypothetical protein
LHSANSADNCATVHPLYRVGEHLGDVAGIAHPSYRVHDGTRDRSERQPVAHNRRRHSFGAFDLDPRGAAHLPRVGNEDMDRRPGARSTANAVAPRGVYAGHDRAGAAV